MKHKFWVNKRKIIVAAQIKGNNNDRKLNLILDTGASKTIIDEGAAVRLGFDVKHLKTGDRLMTAGGGVNSNLLKLPKFSLFGKDIVNFEVNVINMPLQITYFADGLIGMDFLLKFKNIKFDFVENVIETM